MIEKNKCFLDYMYQLFKFSNISHELVCSETVKNKILYLRKKIKNKPTAKVKTIVKSLITRKGWGGHTVFLG